MTNRSSEFWPADLSQEYMQALAKRDPEENRKLYLQEWPVNPRRGTGTTTEQIMALPIDSVFVVLASARDYMKDLLRHLGRDDVRLATYDMILDGDRINSARTGLEVDHAVWDYLIDRGSSYSYGRFARAIYDYQEAINKRKDHNG